MLKGYTSDVNLVFVTHDDYDHYDPRAIETLCADSTTGVVYECVDTNDLDHPS